MVGVIVTVVFVVNKNDNDAKNDLGSSEGTKHTAAVVTNGYECANITGFVWVNCFSNKLYSIYY